MKINSLLENQTPSSSTVNAASSAPEFGRDDDKLEETTTSGSVATVASPVGGMQRRGKGSMLQGIKTSEKFPNSKTVKESQLDEVDPMNYDSDEDYYDAVEDARNPYSGMSADEMADELARMKANLRREKSETLRRYYADQIDKLENILYPDDEYLDEADEWEEEGDKFQRFLAYAQKQLKAADPAQRMALAKRLSAQQVKFFGPEQSQSYNPNTGAPMAGGGITPSISAILKMVNKPSGQSTPFGSVSASEISGTQQVEIDNSWRLSDEGKQWLAYAKEELQKAGVNSSDFMEVARALSQQQVKKFGRASMNPRHDITAEISMIIDKIRWLGVVATQQSNQDIVDADWTVTELMDRYNDSSPQEQAMFRAGVERDYGMSVQEFFDYLQEHDQLPQARKQQSQTSPADDVFAEAKKANTKTARKEFGKRDKKPTLSDKEKDAKQSESDRLWAMLQQHIDDAEKNKDVKEGEEMGTFAALKDWRVWDVRVFNNFYAGKYADYGPRLYSVVASSPEEARQVVIDNADYVLQDLLSRKLQNGKKVLPRGSALPVEEKRVGKADPGTITTMGFKKMLTPDGVQSFKFTNGKIVDGAHVKGGEETMDESLEKDFQKVDYRKFSTPTLMNALKTLAKSKTPNVDLQKGISRELLNRVNNQQGVAEGSRIKTPSGMYRDQHTGVAYSKPTGQDGHDSYMTPEYLIQKYKERLAQIAAGPYERPKEVAQLQSRIAKLEKQGVAEETSNAPTKYRATVEYGPTAADAHFVTVSANSTEEAEAKVQAWCKKKGVRNPMITINGADKPINEKSKSQAQFRTMAAVAHNPKFAKKVGISQKVGKEFHSADRKQDYKDLPKEVDEEKQRLDPKCWTGYKKQGTKMKGGVRVNNCVKVDEAEFTEDKLAQDLYRDLQIFKKGADKDIGSKAKDKEIGNKPQDKDIVAKEDWQKTNKHDKTDGMSPKAVKAYRRENPGSKLKTAVTKKPSELKPGSKDANRRKSFCARMSGNKGPMKDENGKPTPKAKALKRWNCE